MEKRKKLRFATNTFASCTHQACVPRQDYRVMREHSLHIATFLRRDPGVPCAGRRSVSGSWTGGRRLVDETQTRLQTSLFACDKCTVTGLPISLTTRWISAVTSAKDLAENPLAGVTNEPETLQCSQARSCRPESHTCALLQQRPKNTTHTHSLIHSDSRNHSLTHSLTLSTRSLTRSLSHPLTHIHLYSLCE